MIQLTKKILISGKIEVLTGLHIGGSNTTLQIGGVDAAVVRNPLNNQPYIPGSSLKGKMRTLLEQSTGEIGGPQGGKIEHGPSKDGKVARLFGQIESNSSSGYNIPSRIIVRDGNLLNATKWLENKNFDLPYTESKTEIVMDRITAAATPRQLERVPAGMEFTLNIAINIFSDSNEKEMMELVYNGMRLLQDDYLGGKGSRGSGQIKFHVEKVIERPASFYTENKTETEKTYTQVQLPEDLK